MPGTSYGEAATPVRVCAGVWGGGDEVGRGSTCRSSARSSGPRLRRLRRRSRCATAWPAGRPEADRMPRHGPHRRDGGSPAPGDPRRMCSRRGARGRCAAGIPGPTATRRTRARRPRALRARAGRTAPPAAAPGESDRSSPRSVARSTRLSNTSDSAASPASVRTSWATGSAARRSAPSRPTTPSSSARSASTFCHATYTSASPSGTAGITPASTTRCHSVRCCCTRTRASCMSMMCTPGRTYSRERWRRRRRCGPVSEGASRRGPCA